MTLDGRMDRLRIDFAVLRYDALLDLRGGVSSRRRRALCRELRANLVDASTQVGSREAVRRLGSLRRLAVEAAAATRDPARPRWAYGALVAVQAFSVALMLEVLAVLWWMDGAHDSGAPTVRGSLPLFPASAVEYSRVDGVSLAVEPGWLVLAVAFVAFAVASRPWLIARRRSTGVGQQLEG